MINFHDPRAEVATPMESYALSHGFSETGAGTTVGLLANGFPDSDNFLEKVGEVLQERLPDIEIKFWNKGNPTITASDSLLNEITASCHTVIAAYGH